MKTKLYLIILPLLFFTIGVRAQGLSGSVSGLVKSETGEVVPFVTVTAENVLTHIKTIAQTDTSGVYHFPSLPVQGNYKFIFTSIGYEPQTLSEYTIKAGQSITMLVRLTPSNSVLNQVVVTGYATQRKKDLTGAVSIVNVNDAKTTPAAGIDDALQGRVAGVTVVSSNQPGGGVAVRIRGLGTINNSDPLYIIDGIPVTGNLNTVNPGDIESIQVLKDASSASIYGARAANGVVIITTLKAKSGAQIRYDGYTGVQQAYNLPTLLNANQYGQLWFTALSNAGQTPPVGNPYGNGAAPVIPAFLDAAKTTPSGNTNWYKEIFQPAMIESHTVNFLNGSDKGSTAFNVGYYQQNGILKYASGFTRYTARLNTDYNFFKRLKVGEFVSIANTQSNSVADNEALGSAITSVLFADPLLPVYDINHNFAGPAANMPIGGRSPLSSLYSQKDNYNKEWRILGKVFADLIIIKGLTASTNFAVDYTNFNAKNFSPTYTEGILVNNTNSVSFNNSYTLNTTWTNTLTYKHSFGKNSLEVLAGTEYIHGLNETLAASTSVLPSNDINVQQLNAGTSSATNSGNGFQNALFSVFGKVNYAYNDKYLASVTVRNDASSKLAPGYNTQTFPAFSLGWRISDEPFFTKLKDKVNELKLRGGWGQTGNQAITDYSFYSTYAPNLTADNSYYDINGSNTGAVTGYSQNRIGNNLLRWETSTQTNIGLDIAALNNRINLTVDVFDKKTNDLLVQPQLPSTFGASTPPFINGGSMDNRGIEMELGYGSNSGRAFNYSVNGNVSFINNKLTSLTPDLSYIPSPISNTLTRNLELQRSAVGQPIASFYGYQVTGIFQNQQQVTNYINQPGKAVGHFIYADENNDGVIDDKDRVFLGSPTPTLNYGLNLKMSYKNFDFWAFLQGVSGNKIFDFNKEYTDFFSAPSSSNKSTDLLNAWSPGNMTNSGPPILSVSNTANDTRPSSYFIQSGAYARLKTLQLGYTFSNGIFKDKTLRSLRIYVQAQNLFTITKYTGMDPEVGLQDYSNTNSNLDMGVDRGIYPASRTFMLGVNVKL